MNNVESVPGMMSLANLPHSPIYLLVANNKEANFGIENT